MGYWIRKRFYFVTGERRFVALEVEFDDRQAPTGKRVERELYVVDDSGLELFVGYIGQLYREAPILRHLERRVARMLDISPTIVPSWCTPCAYRGEVSVRDAWRESPIVVVL